MVKAPKNMAYVAETLERMERGELKVVNHIEKIMYQLLKNVNCFTQNVNCYTRML